MAKKLDKIILTNQTALTAKYGVSGLRRDSRRRQSIDRGGCQPRIDQPADRARRRSNDAPLFRAAGHLCRERASEQGSSGRFVCCACAGLHSFIGLARCHPAAAVEESGLRSQWRGHGSRAAGDLPYACETGTAMM